MRSSTSSERILKCSSLQGYRHVDDKRRTALIVGEHGVGKTLVGQTSLHSPRKDNPFVA